MDLENMAKRCDDQIPCCITNGGFHRAETQAGEAVMKMRWNHRCMRSTSTSPDFGGASEEEV